MILQETFVLIDGSFVDIGTNSNYSSWTATDFTGTKISRNTEYTTLTPSDDWDVQDQTISNSDLCIEFDMNLTYTASSSFIRFRGSGTNVQTLNQSSLGISSGVWSHVKLTRIGNTLNIVVDGVTKTQAPINNNLDTFRLVLSNTSSTDLKYKNFVIYPI